MIPGPSDYCLTFLVRHAWLSMRGVVAAALADVGLSVAQYGTLVIVAEEPGISVADVARHASSTRQSANELLTGLERAGLVERQPNPTDRRIQRVLLTDAGRERLRAADPIARAAEAQLEAGFTADEQNLVRRWLAGMAGAPTEAATDTPAEAPADSPTKAPADPPAVIPGTA